MKHITFYRAYWPEVWQCTKCAQYKTSEAFGLLMTLEIASIFADEINNLLPAGAVVDMVKA